MSAAKRETWLPIDGWEGRYEVSTRGRVRSVDRYDRHGRLYRGRVLALSRHAITGAPVCTLSDVPRRAAFYPLAYLRRLDLEPSKPAENRGNVATSANPAAGTFGQQRKL